MIEAKKTIVKFVLLGVVIGLCCSCGPSLKSMKDADNYLKEDRLKCLRNGEGWSGVDAWTPKVTVSKDSPGSIALLGLGLLTASVPLDYIAAAAYAPTTLIGISEEVRNQPVTGNIMSIDSYVSNSMSVLYRNELGKPEWDIGKEAIKRVGQLPVRHAACKVQKFEIWDKMMATEYKGQDGEIVIKGLTLPKLTIYGKRNVEPPCTTEDLLIYKDYMLKITAAIAHIMKEEEDKLNTTIFREYPELQKVKDKHRGKISWRDRDTKKEWIEE